ncbi:MAG: CCA tRNA nucleotidyltransferase [Planctomycetes bacterium]|nr:CCA tRNA nucleotidyltransferase [Planctomycetota bacterium]
MKLPNTSEARFATHVVSKLKAAGYEALLAGGCVRDLLLGNEPKDYDIATSASPNDVETWFERTIAVGKAFGVIVVQGEDCAVEVATFRADGDYSDGRRPDSVRFTNAQEDAERRDFTINALFLDVESGKVIDYVDGQSDLTCQVIRAVGDPAKRFAEDKLRLLRAVRFAANLKFEIEPATKAAITAASSDVATCSAERIQAELTKLLTRGNASHGFRLMSETGLLKVILPEIEAMHGVEQPPEHHPEGDVFIHTMLALDHLPADASLTVRLAALLHDVGKPETFKVLNERIRFIGHDSLGSGIAWQILNRLKFSTEVIRRVVFLVSDHLRFMNVQKMKTSTLKRFFREPYFEELLILHRADCLAGSGNLEDYEFAVQKLKEFKSDPEILHPKLPIDGSDLIELGLEPGPEFKALLRAIEDEVLEGRLNTREQALEFVKSLVNQ